MTLVALRLIELGLDPRTQTNLGASAAAIAREMGHLDLAATLEQTATERDAEDDAKAAAIAAAAAAAAPAQLSSP
jgi:hypothetical protein|tara:strand:- start:267 stop:491 length:225 start_codon:yes stop_codon:yes gene_type:complete